MSDFGVAVPEERGRAILAEARARFGDVARMQARFAELAALLPDAGALVRAEEVPDNVADLVIRFRFERGESLVGKYFLPILKGRPTIGYAGFEDRGRGIDRRMRLFARLAGEAGVRVPHAFVYDEVDRGVLMEDLGEELPAFDTRDGGALAIVGKALAAVHAFNVTARERAELEDPARRELLRAYPERFLGPHVEDAGARAGLTRFSEADRSLAPVLVHGDLCPKNLTCAEGRVALFDFERANVASPAYDLGVLAAHVALSGWEREEPAAGPLAELVDAFTGGCPLRPELAASVAGHGALTLAYRLGQPAFLHLAGRATAEEAARAIARLLSAGTDGSRRDAERFAALFAGER